jgi:hypothetical protein
MAPSTLFETAANTCKMLCYSEAKSRDNLITSLALMPVDSQFVVFMKDKYHDAIVETLKNFGEFRPRDVYTPICLALGASQEDALNGRAPCPYTGNIKDMRALIRFWIEERSPHSRRQYFRNGKRAKWGNKRPLLFVNHKLGEMNNANSWMPKTYSRGDRWSYNPTTASQVIQPTEDVLNFAAAAYVKKGQRGTTPTIAYHMNTGAVFHSPHSH